MVSPALSLLAPVATPLLIYSLITVLLWRLLPLYVLSISAKWLAVAFISSVPLRIVSKDLARKYEAAELGARQMPIVQGKLFGNIDWMFTFIKAMKSGYPADGPAKAISVVGNCFNIRLMYRDTLFTCEPHHIKAILATDFENFVKGEGLRSLAFSVLGTGVFNSDGDMWKFHRSMTRPFFTHDRISHFSIFDRHSEDMISQMKARLRAGYAVDFQDAISRFTLDSATEFLFGRCVHSLSAGLVYPYNATQAGNLGRHSNAADDFARAFLEAQIIVSQRARRSWMWPLFELSGDKTAKPMKIVNAYIEPITKGAIEKRRMGTLCGEKSTPSDEDTLLDHLVGLTTDPAILRDEILNIMIAGRDTTAGTLTFTIYLLATHPHTLVRLREEIMAKVGPRDRPTYDVVREMKYLRAVINETLRLFPAVPFNARESVKTTTFPSPDSSGKPYYVPANTQVLYSVFVMHRRKDLWGPDAEEFDPGRFLDDRVQKYLTPQPFIFLPFNGGPRICLGQQFAYHEMSFVLIRLLQQFDSISLASDAQAPDTLPPAAWREAQGRKAKEKVCPKMHFTMYVQGGLWVRMAEATKPYE